MTTTVSYEIGLDTPINLLTPRQLFEMQKDWIRENMPDVVQSDASQKWYVNSMGELASILGSSVSTLYKMKAAGLLDEAISQYGKWMMIDVDKVIEKFKLSNRRTRRKK